MTHSKTKDYEGQIAVLNLFEPEVVAVHSHKHAHTKSRLETLRSEYILIDRGRLGSVSKAINNHVDPLSKIILSKAHPKTDGSLQA